MTSIEWTDETWSPILGCSRVSTGCENCYAERFVHRGLHETHRGLTVLSAHGKGPRWTGEVRLIEERLALPLRWRKPRRVFVNPMSDLFHEALPMQAVARIFAVMAEADRHTFQVLTKRPKRMRELLSSALFWDNVRETAHALDDELIAKLDRVCDDRSVPNVWLGVTAEDQQRADERVPLLLDTPAAVRFVSYEPALGPVTFRPEWLSYRCRAGHYSHRLGGVYRVGECPHTGQFVCGWPLEGGLNWLIVGGESGPGARPFDLAWARSALAQCKAAGVPVFFKQLGRRPVTQHPMGPLGALVDAPLLDRKGGDIGEWPADLRVREFPR